MPVKYKFCRKCGDRLVEKEMFIGYNRYTGREELENFLTCPQLLEDHDKWEVSKPIPVVEWVPL